MQAALTQTGVRCVLRISRHTADSVKTHDLLRIENRLEISRRFAHSGLRTLLKFQDGSQSGVGFHSGLPIPTLEALRGGHLIRTLEAKIQYFPNGSISYRAYVSSVIKLLGAPQYFFYGFGVQYAGSRHRGGCPRAKQYAVMFCDSEFEILRDPPPFSIR